ncbi:TMV resistance protein N-like [Solanum stenotomum]|uniref:TMV resistance protein N-like n=1 Tax=Solanum stenotomum TaxID=172797 RepID=UPI0020D0ADC6|nr:TMV resistance protein N-like [Solanum stenotomum]
MDDLIQEMGKYVVKMHKDSGEPSRIWNIEDFKEVIDNNTGTMTVEAIWYTYFGKYALIKRGLPKFGDISRNHSKNKSELEIKVKGIGIREIPSSIIQHQAHLTKLDLSVMEKLKALSSSIGMLKGLVKLDVSWCPKFKNLPEEIGDLENMEELDASCTRILQPPSSIVQWRTSGRHWMLIVFERLHLNGNNFVHLPGSIAQLGDLETLYLSNCKRLPQLPEFSKQLHTISAHWSNDLICNSLFQNISYASDSLSLRALMSWGINKPG